MMYKFECPFCSQRISTTIENAGTIGVCPACHREFEVPAPPPERPTVTAPIAPLPPAASSPRIHTRPMLATICPACLSSIEVPLPQPQPRTSAIASQVPEKRSALSLAIIALALCMIPWILFRLFREFGGNISSDRTFQTAFSLLVVVSVVLGLAGLVAGHISWRRAVGQHAAGIISIVSLTLGYFLMIIMALFVEALAAGRMVLRSDYKEPPDFKPAGGDLVPPEISPSDFSLDSLKPPPDSDSKRPPDR